MSKYIYGVDFGTSNSSLAILDTSSNEIVKLFTTPSLLFFPEYQKSFKTFYFEVGHKAVETYVESKMQGRFMKSIKAVLPNPSFTKTWISNRTFMAEDLVALIISFLKKQADDFLGETITEAVIGRPVVFSENPDKEALAQDRLQKAVQLAGFERFYFQMEPIAAAYTYERQIQKKELVLVGDFGGGTSDFTLMNLRPNATSATNRTEDMIAKGGIYIGGDNFDSKIMWHRGTPHFGRGVKEQFDDKWLDLSLSYFTKITSWEKMNFLNTLKMKEAIEKSYVFSGRDYRVKNLLTLIEQNLGYLLFKQIEKAKIDLTNSDTTNLVFDPQTINLNEEISIKELATTIIPLEVEKITAYLDDFLSRNNYTYNQIDTVFLTGGSSMVRPLKQQFVERFGAHKLKSGDNFNSVAMGLALSYQGFKK